MTTSNISADTWRPTTKNRLYDLVAPFDELLHKAVYWPKFNEWCRTKAAGVPVFSDRLAQYQYVIDQHGLGGPVDFLEFGVFHGDSLLSLIHI